MQSLTELLATGHIEDAAVRAHERLGAAPGDPDALVALARVALVKGQPDEAEALLAQAGAKASPRDVTLVRAGVACMKANWAAARRLYESLTRQPDAPAEAWYGLGLAQGALGSRAAACEALEKAVDLNPYESSFRFELGRALTLMRQARAAVYHLVRGLRLNPWDERGYRVVADILLQRGHSAQARRMLELGLHHAPGSSFLREGLAQLPPGPGARADGLEMREDALIPRVNELLERNRNREALTLLREASQRGLRTVGLKLLEADACEALLPPDIDGATRAYEEAIALEPEHWVGYSNLGLFLLRQGGGRGLLRAIQVLEEARRRGPTRPEPVLNLALAYLKGGRDAEAVELAAQLVQGLPPQHPIATQARQLVGAPGE